MTFNQRLKSAWVKNDSLVCVGLDPDLDRLPLGLGRDHAGVLEFCKTIVDSTADLVCAFKPQIAYFAALRMESVLKDLIAHIKSSYPEIPVILDAKRGDIGSTAKQYAVEAFDRYQADAVTVNPYLGGDTIKPFLDHTDRGVIVLCRTSNPGAADFQDLIIEGQPLFMRVAEKAAKEWNENGNCGLVVGATWPAQLGQVRELTGSIPILVPGVGAQGGDPVAVIQNGCDEEGLGLLVNSSRGVLYASGGDDYADKARMEAQKLRNTLNQYRNRPA